MSKSLSAIKAKPFVQKIESDKAARKLETRINAKVEAQRKVDPSYDLRRNLQMSALTRGFGGIYG